MKPRNNGKHSKSFKNIYSTMIKPQREKNIDRMPTLERNLSHLFSRGILNNHFPKDLHPHKITMHKI